MLGCRDIGTTDLSLVKIYRIIKIRISIKKNGTKRSDKKDFARI